MTRDEVNKYLAETATPGGTMTRQGVDVAIERLHPGFASNLAETIRQARAEGIPASLFSAYRPPGYNVGGYAGGVAGKFNSLHSYGLSVDFAGIGRPGSPTAQRFYDIAIANGLFNPYGPKNKAEWNHFQAVPMKGRQFIEANPQLKATITQWGPVDPEAMWRASGVQFKSDGLLGTIGDWLKPAADALRVANEPLQRGVTGTKANPDARVAGMQQILAAQGFYKGAIDGVFGKGTEKAVKESGLAPDGIVTADTRRSLGIDTSMMRPADVPTPLSPRDVMGVSHAAFGPIAGPVPPAISAFGNQYTMLRDAGGLPSELASMLGYAGTGLMLPDVGAPVPPADIPNVPGMPPASYTPFTPAPAAPAPLNVTARAGGGLAGTVTPGNPIQMRGPAQVDVPIPQARPSREVDIPLPSPRPERFVDIPLPTPRPDREALAAASLPPTSYTPFTPAPQTPFDVLSGIRAPQAPAPFDVLSGMRPRDDITLAMEAIAGKRDAMKAETDARLAQMERDAAIRGGRDITTANSPFASGIEEYPSSLPVPGAPYTPNFASAAETGPMASMAMSPEARPSIRSTGPNFDWAGPAIDAISSLFGPGVAGAMGSRAPASPSSSPSTITREEFNDRFNAGALPYAAPMSNEAFNVRFDPVSSMPSRSESPSQSFGTGDNYGMGYNQVSAPASAPSRSASSAGDNYAPGSYASLEPTRSLSAPVPSSPAPYVAGDFMGPAAPYGWDMAPVAPLAPAAAPVPAGQSWVDAILGAAPKPPGINTVGAPPAGHVAKAVPQPPAKQPVAQPRVAAAPKPAGGVPIPRANPVSAMLARSGINKVASNLGISPTILGIGGRAVQAAMTGSAPAGSVAFANPGNLPGNVSNASTMSLGNGMSVSSYDYNGNNVTYGTYIDGGGNSVHSGTTVLCGYYADIGWLPRELWKADNAFAKTLPKAMRRTYWRWAIPAVRRLRAGDKRLQVLLWPIVKAWASYAGWRMGVLPRRPVLGTIVHRVCSTERFSRLMRAALTG